MAQQKTQTITGRPLVAGCAAIALAFVGATLVAQHESEGIDAQALLIANEASPNLQAISDARTEVRHLESMVSRALADAGAHTGEGDLGSARPDLEGKLERFKLVGDDSPRLLAQFRTALHQLDLSAERALLLARSAPGPEALRAAEPEVHERAEAAAAKGSELATLDVARVEAAAVRIELLRRHASLRELRLDALCLAAAAAIAALLYASHRRLVTLQAAHASVLLERANELEQFAGRVAHDILGPIGAATLALDLASRTSAEESRRQAALARGRSSLGRVQRLVHGLLEFARAGAPVNPGPGTEVAPLVSGLLDELAAEAARARVTLAAGALPACTVACPEGAVLSVLSNLLRNGIKYIGDGERREVTLRVCPAPGRVRLEVEDTGPGIPPELGDRVFQPWVRGKQTHQAGMGIGLATVKRLVEAHGGALGVKPGSDGGALFWVELPRADDVTPMPGLPLALGGASPG